MIKFINKSKWLKFVNGRKVVIGSHHFVFEDEGCQVPEGLQERFETLPEEYSHLYLAMEGKLAAVICIEDPLREEAAGRKEGNYGRRRYQ